MVEAPKLVAGGRYELEELVGQGGYGVVYRAVDRTTGERVAVKVLTAGSASDPHGVERMVREQQALVALAGTSAVSAVDLCCLPSGALCLVMEWLEGEDLERQLTRLEATGTKLDLDRVLEILKPVVSTLGRAHEVGIVHRDIKPGNIFLTRPDGAVRLLDFGLSRMKSQAPLTALGMVMGSPSYIAPEAWRGDSKLVDHRADLYSLTVVAFRMLTGRVPFHSETLLEQLSLVTTAERPSLHALRPDLPRDIDDWVTQALAVRPDYRFNTARAWYSALVQVLSEGDVPAGTIEPERPETTPVERRNAVVAAFDAASSLLRRLAGQAPASLDRPVEAPPSAGSDVPLALSPVAPLEGDSDRDPATESSVPWTSLASSTWRVSAGEEEHPEDGDRRSFVSEWLSGSALDPEALARATDADVIDWLRGDTSPEATPSSDAASSGIRAFGERLAETVAAEHTRGDSGREGEAAPPAAAAPPSTADSGGVRHPVSKKNEATPKKKQKTENQKQPAAKQPGTRKRAGTRKQPAAKKKPAVKKQPAKQKPPVSPQKRAARGKAASKKRRRH